jgi:hypothetical protein
VGAGEVEAGAAGAGATGDAEDAGESGSTTGAGAAASGAAVLVLAMALSVQLHKDVHPFQVELVSFTRLHVTTPQLVPVKHGLAGLPAAPRLHACACPS